MNGEPKRVRLNPLTIHPATERYIRKIKIERAIPLGQAIDILFLDLQAAQRRVKELETRLVETTRLANER